MAFLRNRSWVSSRALSRVEIGGNRLTEVFAGCGGFALGGIGKENHFAGGPGQGAANGIGHLMVGDDLHLAVEHGLQLLGKLRGRAAEN